MGRGVIRGLNLRHEEDFEWVYKLGDEHISIGKIRSKLDYVCILG